MKIAFISTEIGVVSSGQSRFTINLARGLQEAGADVRVYCAHASERATAQLSRAGVQVQSLGMKTETPFFRTRLLSGFTDIDRRIAELARSNGPSDWYVVLSDELIGSVKALAGVRTVHISNGNLALLFLNPNLARSAPLSFRLLSLGMSGSLRAGGRYARMYDLVLANSQFTQKFMSYLYGRPIDGVVYPPVDTSSFHWSPRTKGDYCLLLARNSFEQNLDLVANLANDLPIRVVGGARIPGTESVGEVTDETLSSLYSEARLVLYPTVSEFFGYAVAEALSCGTPVIAFASAGGPSELVQEGINGWLCPSLRDFDRRARLAYAHDYLELEPERIVASAGRFSMLAVAREFLTVLSSKPSP